MLSLPRERIILGIDPGTTTMGFGVIKQVQQQLCVLQHEVVQLAYCKTHTLKLQKIFEHTLRLVDTARPDEVALEAPFCGKNVQAMLKLGRAQGVAMAAALVREVPITEYAPRRVKQAVTGNGHASKEQVARMLATLLRCSTLPEQLDATDALAVAVCHAYQGKGACTKPMTWKQLLRDNLTRVHSAAE